MPYSNVNDYISILVHLVSALKQKRKRKEKINQRVCVQKLDLYKALKFLACSMLVGIHLFEYIHFVIWCRYAHNLALLVILKSNSLSSL